MNLRHDVIHRIEAYLRETGLSPTAFGRQAVGDGKLMPRLRRGENVTLGTIERALAFIEANPSPSRPPPQAGEEMAPELAA